ncbi:hypothetical protein MT325_m226R [Paramecium bursaria chlorella virus MT325]|uniref:Uncharacterized protein m226R n=1 Tax=Paramecium bursaria Chlorella virus MT325 TaxID=346932 RepID=A7ITV6_PBCVM|nr:hypothetical protein MT325_m226R [Paramecium bursaria chlorella virus MT325]
MLSRFILVRISSSTSLIVFSFSGTTEMSSISVFLHWIIIWKKLPGIIPYSSQMLSRVFPLYHSPAERTRFQLTRLGVPGKGSFRALPTVSLASEGKVAIVWTISMSTAFVINLVPSTGQMLEMPHAILPRGVTTPSMISFSSSNHE